MTGKVREALEALAGTQDKITAIDRLRMHVVDPETFEFSYDDAYELCEQIDAALAALDAPAEGEGWRDMGSAPKDGTEVIYLTSYGSRWIGNEPPGHARGIWTPVEGEWRGMSSSSNDVAWHSLPPSPGVTWQVLDYAGTWVEEDADMIDVRRSQGHAVRPLYSATALERVTRERDEARAEAEMWHSSFTSNAANAANAIGKSIDLEERLADAEAKLAEALADRAAQAERIRRLEAALRNLAHEMRFLLRNNPKMDGGLYRQRLHEADTAIGGNNG